MDVGVTRVREGCARALGGRPRSRLPSARAGTDRAYLVHFHMAGWKFASESWAKPPRPFLTTEIW
ncbi:hypothetical protein GCM10010345_90990 [Streptomyces canarius]|uniref:Transposase n=1 Tax=Streptomyces canarius TaxID=285453 RepID=A0ABQ3DF66_9ACTN|nr:hypothetical protein GCM10010345_90990 [Streptomyces canarius]